jgi:RNA polymerase sigma-70 factor, ECF subfamily
MVMIENDEFKAALIENLPHLRAFAHLIARNHATAEDLVQDTLLRALAKRHQFAPGTNLKGWLIIIMRNRFFNLMRKSSHKAEIGTDRFADMRAVNGGQEAAIEIAEFKDALARLPATHREALILVGASGYSYEEAAEIAGVPTGTMKSRVSRARAELEAQLHGVEMPEAWLRKSA